MENTITIKARTVTPLLQLDNEGKQRKRYEIFGDSSVSVAFFSANGLRGLMRRVATRDMIEMIRKNDSDFKIKAEELQLYAAGASADKKSIDNVDFNDVAVIREKSPILSLFGAGLSQIAGKVAVCDLKPKVDENVYKVVQKHHVVRNDETERTEFFTELMDSEDIQRWKEEHKKEVLTSKNNKKSGEADKEKTSNIQQYLEVEYIAPGVEMFSCINPIGGFKFSEIEVGLLLKTIKEISKQQIGAGKRYNFGLLDWEVSLDGESMIEVIRDENYVANIISEDILTDAAKEYVSKYEKWALENYSSKSISIDNMLKKCA